MAILIGLAASLPFVRSVCYGRINLDDSVYLPDSGVLTQGLTKANLISAFADVGEFSIWMPLTRIAYGVDFEIGGPVKAEHVAHFFNVVAHAANACLLFLFLSLLVQVVLKSDSLILPAVGALFWALHPLRCESVAWIASKKDLLSAFFFLAALIAWLRFRLYGVSRRRWPCYAASMALLVLGALCKPSVMIFIGYVVILDLFLLRVPFTLRDDRILGRRLLEYAAPFLLCVAIAAEATWAQRLGGATSLLSTIPLSWRLVNAVVSCGVYLIHTFCPTDLACQCIIQYPAWPRLTVPAIIAVGLLLHCFRRAWPDERTVCGGVLMFLGGLVPVLGIVGFGYHAFADRFTYLPAIGLSIAVIGALAHLSEKTRRGGAFRVCVCALLGTLGGMAWHQTGFWRDDPTLWNRTLAVDGDGNHHANIALACWHWDVAHDLPRCIRHFERAWKFDRKSMEDYSVIYMAALVEAGEAEKAQALMPEINALVYERCRNKDDSRTDWNRSLALALCLTVGDNRNPDESARILAELEKANPGGVDGLSSYLHVASVVARARGLPEKAKEYERRCCVASADNPVFKFRYLRKEK